jgi:hypothetical protein
MITVDEPRFTESRLLAAPSPMGEGCPTAGQPEPVGKVWDERENSRLISYFKMPIQNTKPNARVGLPLVYNLIRGDVFKKPTLELRALEDENQIRNFKASNFDYVTFSGLFSRRNGKCLLRHSGLLCLDFDHLDDPAALKMALIRDKYFETQLAFISPSGQGLKWIIPIEVTSLNPHERWFSCVRSYIGQNYRVEVDPSGRDVVRACFLPWDPNAYINPKLLP